MSQPSGYLDPSPVTVVYDEVDEVDDLPLSPPLDTPTTVNIDELPDEIPEISDVPWDEQFEWHPQFQFPQVFFSFSSLPFNLFHLDKKKF